MLWRQIVEALVQERQGANFGKTTACKKSLFWELSPPSTVNIAFFFSAACQQMIRRRRF